jgi:hypothetical protein
MRAGAEGVVVNQALLLLSLLVIPGLIGLPLLMEWLERTFTHRQVADEIARLIAEDEEADRIEDRIAQAAQPLFH